MLEKEVLNSKETALYLGLKSRTAYRSVERLARTGKLKGFLPSRKEGWRFHVDALRNRLVLGR